MRSDLEIVEAARSSSALVGGAYFEHPDDLLDTGRVLHRAAPKDDEAVDASRSFRLASAFASLVERIDEGELLFALYERNGVLLAPYLYSEERLSDFETQVDTGLLRRVAFVAAPRAAVGNRLTL